MSKSVTSPRTQTIPAGYPPLLRARLRAFARLSRLRDLAADSGLTILVVASLVVASCVFDRFVDVPGTWRLPATLMTAAVATLLSGRCLVRLLWPADYDRLAAALDHAAGDRREHLRSLLDFSRRGLSSDSFPGISAFRGAAFWKGRSAGKLVDHRPLRAAVAAAAVVAAMAAVSQVEAVRAGLLWQRFIDPLGNHMRPTATWLEVEPPPAEGLEGGDDYVIRARIRGRPVADPVLLVRVEPLERATSVARLVPRGDAWELPLADLERNFSFVVTLGAARSEAHQVGVKPRPRIGQIRVGYEPPAYSGLPRREEELSGRTITALEETKLRIKITADIPLAGAAGQIGEQQYRFTVDPRDPRKATCFVFLSANARMDLLLVGNNGLDNPRELPLHLRVVPDAPPVVVFTNDPAARPLFPSETVRFDFKAQDDIGLAEVAVAAVKGGFAQEAELEKIGAREAAGTIALPVALVAPPGASSVQLRLSAIDGKGQRGNSAVVTLRIASDSYEQQLRAVLRSLDGQTTSGNENARGQLGFPARTRHAARLTALRGLAAKLTIINELGGDPADPKAAPQAAEARKLAATHDAGFDYLMPTWTPGHEGLRAFDVLGRMPMTVRLQAIFRDATAGAELAVPWTAVRAAVEAAFDPAAADRTARLAALQATIDTLVTRQEEVVRRLDDFARVAQVELAGFLATQLALGGFADADRDRIVAARAWLADLAGLVTGPLATLPEGMQPIMTPEVQAGFKAAIDELDDAAALEAAAALCARTLSILEETAARLAADPAIQELGVAAFVADLETDSDPGRRDVYALWIATQTDDTDIDEERLLAHASASERLLAGDGFAAPAPVPSADPAAVGLRMMACLSRLADQAAAVRATITSGAAASDPTLMEASWVRLRELTFAIEREAKTGATVPPQFLASLAAARPWLPAPAALADLPSRLVAWERQARELEATFAELARGRLAAVASGVANWPAEAGAALDGYIREVDALVARLETAATADDAHRQLPRLDARLSTIAAAALQRLAIVEAARLQAAGQPAGVEMLAAFRIAVGKLREDLRSRVGAVTAAMAKSKTGSEEDPVRAQARGKVKACVEHRATVLQARGLCVPQATAATEEALGALGVAHVVASDWKEMLAAAAIALEPPATSATLVNQPAAEGDGMATFWGTVLAQLLDLRARLGTDEAAAAIGGARDQLACLTTLPREARGLADWLDQPAVQAADAARDLDAVIADVRPLARPPAVYPEELRMQQQWQAVWRQRFALAGDAAARQPLAWAVTDLEWLRRKRQAAAANVGIGGLAASADDDLSTLALPRHIYLELKRAREGAMPELHRDRSNRYLKTILEKAR